MSQDPSKEPIPSNTDSVVNVTDRYALDVSPLIETLKIKCSQCKGLNKHEWTKAMPLPINAEDAEVDALSNMSNIRRLIMCTQCGHLSLKS